jgi:3'-phosphoadenosine 5'-phosphosulfate sulfotransferase (PAPS reductase)/FAD synthetase
MVLEHYAQAAALIREAHARHGKRLVLTTRCNHDSAFAIHLVCEHIPRIRIIYLVEPHTAAFAETLEHSLGVTIERFPIEEDKLVSLVKACRSVGAEAIIHGIRRYQTPNREGKSVIERGAEDGLVRFHPFLDFSPREVADHLAMHDLPQSVSARPKKKKEECGLHCYVPSPV